MKHISIQLRGTRHFCCIDGIPAGPMYDVFDRGVLKNPWPYRAGNNGHEKHAEAVAFAEKLCDYFDEVAEKAAKLCPKDSKASALWWGKPQKEYDETSNLGDTDSRWPSD
jgi:hypothetical protein